MTPDGAPASTAMQLLLTAERLYAQRGIDGVSLRQIAGEAGSSNNSVIQYHYGSKDGLLRAIFTYRLGDLTRRRALLRARVEPDDLRARLEAHILPLVELAEAPDSHYVSFVEQLQRSGAAEVLLDQPEVLQSRDHFLTDMQRLLSGLPEPARSMRIEHAQDLSLHAAAERERAVERGGPLPSFALFVSTIVDGLAGFLAAPSSRETERVIARARPPKPGPTLHLV